MKRFAWAIFVAGMSAGVAQTVPVAPSPAATTPRAPLASAILEPGLDAVRQALAVVRPEKWKASGTVKSEAARNLGSIRQDMEGTLPPLLAAADGAPQSVARGLPVCRNAGALYDVLLRVDAVARLAAPESEQAALDNAVTRLEVVRKDLGDRMQAHAVAGERQVAELRAAAAKAAAVPAPAAAPAPVAKKKKKRSRKG